MPIMLLKSFASIVFAVSAIIAMFTMLEILGRKESKYDVHKLRKIHKINGVVFLLIFLVISYFCLSFIVNTKSELTPRGAFHSVFALTIILLLIIKLSFIKRYRQFFEYAKSLGIIISTIALLTFATSTGYYLLVSEFGTFKNTLMTSGFETPKGKNSIFKIATDTESIKKGRELFNEKCFFCHDTNNREKSLGPGLKGVLKEKYLPVSKIQSNPENIINQIKNPFKDMPSFSYLSDDELKNIVAFLNTL